MGKNANDAPGGEIYRQVANRFWFKKASRLLSPLLFLMVFPAIGSSAESVSKQDQIDAAKGINRTVVTVTEPDVQHPAHDIQYTFQRNDTVVVEAGGCVQTGGSGSTWKRYVNPSGPNSDRLYYGLIRIPRPPQAWSRLKRSSGASR